MTAPKTAEFRIKSTNKIIPAHFNPATLSLTLSTRLGESKGKGKKKGGSQVVNEGSAKLSVDLVFDTTDTLENVCDKTVEIARLLGEKDQPPPQVTFDWGAFSFTGIVDSYKETLEFFSVDGVPLRSTVSLGMTKDEDIFSRGEANQKAAGWSDTGDTRGPAEVSAPPPGGSTTTTATQGGAPEAGRAIAAQNGEESMRFPRSPTLTVDAPAALAPPAGFGSTPGGGTSLGGVPAALPTFAGLRTQSAPLTQRLDPRRLANRVETNTHATDDGALFDLGGRMRTRGSRLGGSTPARIRFEEE
ncbi:hypothetical protein [Vitiosangium sp. GDMCC 1.1324]|uniref:CIS tube protein n=1 Tax=Vitiosangium sp. (strain GDMCC 1.1324) TaxID=2138576 RepID=UPI000D352012|nr:hypothetical protein [Vitiosangium sp. GDMCC 1.1324]PTL85214.1 hypothetical protein DAT35_00340 [Vitiosangium sp. GDMCC 1.1324]